MGHKHLLLGLAAAALVAACGKAREQADSADKVNVAAMRPSLDAVSALAEVRSGAPLSTSLAWLIREGYVIPNQGKRGSDA